MLGVTRQRCMRAPQHGGCDERRPFPSKSRLLCSPGNMSTVHIVRKIVYIALTPDALGLAYLWRRWRRCGAPCCKHAGIGGGNEVLAPLVIMLMPMPFSSLGQACWFIV